MDEYLLNPLIRLAEKSDSNEKLLTSVDGYSIIELKKIKEALEVFKQKIEIEETQKIQNRLAHDIKSPLGAFRKILPDIENGNLSYSNLNTLKLAIERIQAMGRDLTKEHCTDDVFSLEILLNEIIAEKKYELRDKKIKVDYQASPFSQFCFSKANIYELKRCLSNMINNSYEAGATEVTLTAMPWGSFNLIKITDNGHGISEDIESNLFEESFTTKSFGKGIGLSAAKQYLEQLNGHVEYYAENGNTIFAVLIPICHPPDTSVRSNFYDMVVMLDDDEINYKVFKDKFAKSFKTISYFSSFAKMCEQDEFSKDALFVVDLNLGSENGVEVIQQLRAKGARKLLLYTGDNVAVRESTCLRGVYVMDKLSTFLP